MDEKQRGVFRSGVKAICLLAIGALWAELIAFLVKLPTSTSLAIIVCIILLCLLYLVVTTDAQE